MSAPYDQPFDPQISEGSAAVLPDDKGDRSDTPLRVFMSSVFKGYEEHREVVHHMVEALGHEPVLIGENSPAAPRPPQRACLSGVADCDVMVLLLGAEYGTEQRSGKSATHEEWERARDLGKDMLVFKERVKPESEQQAAFILEVRDYETGLSYKPFSSLVELQEELVRALRQVEAERRDAADFAQQLPEPVRSRLESIRPLFPDSLVRTRGLLAAAAADGSDILVRLAEHPPVWATQPGPLVWEATAEFIGASGMTGGRQVRARAIEAGSQRSSLYLALNAIAAAESSRSEEGDRAASLATDPAATMVAKIPAGDRLQAAAAARLRCASDEVVTAVREAGLQDAEDPAMSELGVLLLAWAHCEEGRAEEALAALVTASERHPGRPRLMLHTATLTLRLGLAALADSDQDSVMLEQAHHLATEARNSLRTLGGPSHLAASVACQALLMLGDPANALRVGLAAPDGEATEAEAAHPSVQEVVVDALLMLGRYEEIDGLDVDSFEPWRRSMTLAMQAHARGEPGASRLLRKAFEHAPHEEARGQVAFELATLGESVDETDLSLSDEEAALLKGVAAVQSGDPDSAVGILRPYRLASWMHSNWLWRAQQKQGDQAEAIETLRDAVEQFGPDPLGADLVERLVEGDRTSEAEVAALDGLASSTYRDVRRRLRQALLHIAEDSQDWHKAHEHAAAMHRESPQDSGAAWLAVYALHRQGRNEDARRYLLTHRLTPTSEEAAHLATVLLGGPSASAVDATRLLELAKLFPKSEKVTGSVLLALMTGGDRVVLTEQQADTARELLEAFVERFPASDILWQVSAPSVEEHTERLREMLRQRDSAINWQLLDDVQAGQAPVGLLWSPARPYASLLLDSGNAGGCLNAVSADPETLQRETDAARSSMDATVVLDTSVAVLASRTDISLDQLASVFGRVLVPDELVTDASLAAAEARTRGDATMWYEPALDQIVLHEFSRQERDRMVESSERIVAALKKHRRAPSGDARPDWYPEALTEPLVWDAALRVAAVRGCALWCDDAALRHLAETSGVKAFGTYALYEALNGHPVRDKLPDSSTMKMRLLRARIADVPIRWTEIAHATDDREGTDPAWETWLSRPAAWHDLADAFAGYAHRLRMLWQDDRLRNIPRLAQAACRGIRAAVVEGERKRAIAAVLAVSLLELRDPGRLVPELVQVARLVAAGRDPRSQVDPLPAAAEFLLAAYEDGTDAAVAAQRLLSVCSSLPSADLRTVASVIPSVPDSPVAAESAKPIAIRARPRTHPDDTSRSRARRPISPASAAAAALGEALRARRLSLGLTQQTLAERCGVPRARISAIEAASTRPRFGTLLRLARQMRSALSLVPSSDRPASPRAGITSLTSLGRAIRAARGEQGWRQQDLADRSGVNRALISKIEAASGEALTDTVLKLTDALGLAVRIDHDDSSAFELDDIIAAHLEHSP